MIHKFLSCYVLSVVFLMSCTDDPVTAQISAVTEPGNPVTTAPAACTDADDGVCTQCTADGCTQCSAGVCVDCNEFWEFSFVIAVPTPTPAASEKRIANVGETHIIEVDVVANAGETYIIEVLADGTGIVKDAAGKVIATIPKLAAKTSGGYVIRPSMIPEWLKGAKVTARLAKCFGPITALMLLSDLAYAGMDVSLGGAAAQIGIRLKDCQDRFAKHAAGIQCLVRQGSGTKCLDAVSACPDAFFGANMLASCGAEPGMQELIDALVAAINATSALGGGWGTITPDPSNAIADAIKNGTFATNPSFVCTMRPRVTDCRFTPGDIFPASAGFTEAKTCWENASRGLFESKYEQALKCCTTNECRYYVGVMKDC